MAGQWDSTGQAQKFLVAHSLLRGWARPGAVVVPEGGSGQAWGALG